jgi:hypothetical protein
MALSTSLPWLDITPNLFSQALQAGAHVGLALSDQSLRAQAMAQAQLERQAQAQERADVQAERQREFEETRLLNVQKIAQDAQALAQKQAYENARESRLFKSAQARLAVDWARADTAEKRQEALDKLATSRLDQQKTALALRTKHYNELEQHNRDMLDFQREKAAKEKAPTVVKNVYDPANPFVAIGSVRGTLDQVGMPGEVDNSAVLPIPATKEELVKGKRYRDRQNRVLEWDGENFLDYSQ